MFVCFVRLTGLEPARRETPDPKSGASTNSATGAKSSGKSTAFSANGQISVRKRYIQSVFSLETVCLEDNKRDILMALLSFTMDRCALLYRRFADFYPLFCRHLCVV